MKEWWNLKIKAIFKLRYMRWLRPSEMGKFRWWLFHIYNDFDPFTWSNDRDVQGLIICGFHWN